MRKSKKYQQGNWNYRLGSEKQLGTYTMLSVERANNIYCYCHTVIMILFLFSASQATLKRGGRGAGYGTRGKLRSPFSAAPAPPQNRTIRLKHIKTIKSRNGQYQTFLLKPCLGAQAPLSPKKDTNTRTHRFKTIKSRRAHPRGLSSKVQWEHGGLESDAGASVNST